MIAMILGLSLGLRIAVFMVLLILAVVCLTAAVISDRTGVELAGMSGALVCGFGCVILAEVWMGFWG